MNKKTDIDNIRIQSILLLKAVKIESYSYGIVSHPFINTQFTIITGNKFLDLSVKKEYEEWSQYIENIIMSKDLLHIFMMLNTPWKLTWLKFCKPYMSNKDFSEYLAHSWVEMENPNQDVNVSLKESISWFKSSNKKFLMTEQDYEFWNNIPEKIVLYRGVGKTRNPYGLSYTASKKQAEWFQNRFYKGEGFLIKLNVNKQDILAYFNTRGEDEYIVNTNKYKTEIKTFIL